MSDSLGPAVADAVDVFKVHVSRRVRDRDTANAASDHIRRSFVCHGIGQENCGRDLAML